MIHLLMLVGAVLIARLWQQGLVKHIETEGGMRQTLLALVGPPLLVMVTALALVWMGPQGTMGSAWAGHLGHHVAELVLIVAAAIGLGQVVRAGWSWWAARRHPLGGRAGVEARVIPSQQLFAAQVGFWDPDLVVTQGLLERLTPEQWAAVVAHEEAHRHYRDTFWFLIWGWMRVLSVGLPQTAVLWQELITLRELRADRWAADRVDPVVLAETLFLVSTDGLNSSEWVGVGLSDPSQVQRLSQRVERLLEGYSVDRENGIGWGWLIPVLPLLVVPFHG